MITNQRGVPYWLWGILGGLLLILLVRGCLGTRDEGLRGMLAPHPGDPRVAELPLPVIAIDALPDQARRAQATAAALLGLDSSVPALTPEASGTGVRVQVASLTPTAGGIQVRGSITNTGAAPRDLSASALLFRDGKGQLYGGGSGSVTLAPGQSAGIDMTVPTPPEVGLTLLLNLPPEPPLELVLLAASS